MDPPARVRCSRTWLAPSRAACPARWRCRETRPAGTWPSPFRLAALQDSIRPSQLEVGFSFYQHLFVVGALRHLNDVPCAGGVHSRLNCAEILWNVEQSLNAWWSRRALRPRCP